MSDVPSPFKKELPEYNEREERMLSMIYEKFLGSDLTPEEKMQLNAIDKAMLWYDLTFLLGEKQESEAPELHIDLRYEVRAFGAVGRNPLFIDHAKGSYVYDVDGNKFIDYVCSWGPGILGHSHPEVLEEVVKACFDGLTFGAPTGKENELAQLVKDCVPSMEMMRMVNSGTEAVMLSLIHI